MRQRVRKKNDGRLGKIRKELLMLCDRMAEFSDQCAFLCDAFAAIPTHADCVDPATDRGMSLSAQWMKVKVQEMKQDLQRLHEHVR